MDKPQTFLMSEESAKSKRGRGRPKKEKSFEEMLAQVIEPDKRGRPKKIKTPAEIMLEMNSPRRKRGRPKKIKTQAEILAELSKPKRKRGRPKKNQIPTKTFHTHVMEEDFVFPIYSQDEITKRQDNKTTRQQNDKTTNQPDDKMTRRQKGINKKSPHVLDLKNQHKNSTEKNYEQPVVPINFNPDDWFSNFADQATAYQIKKRINFDQPGEDELSKPKVKFNRPKEKIKPGIKLNLGQEILQEIEETFTLEPARKKVSVNLLKKILLLPIKIIILPFKILDFIVDRTLKFIWRVVKFIFLTILNIFKFTFSGIKFLLSGQKRIVLPVTHGFRKNLKAATCFALICLIIVLPFQILSLKNKTSNLKGQVMGKSIEGFELLKDASSSTKNFDFASASKNFSQAYFNFNLAKSYLENLDFFSQQILKIIPAASQADNLLIIGQLSASLGENLSLLAQKLQNKNEDFSLIEKLKDIQLTLNLIEPHFLELNERLADIDFEILSKYISPAELDKVILFNSSLGVLRENFDNLKKLVNFLLNFFGQNETKRYLVIFQNNSELRPTGGFMGSYALVEIKDGKILKMEVPNGGFYDLKAANQITVEAPRPFHLFSPYWQIWNANWFPDWSASAKKISWFYENSLAGVTLDGILSLTPNVIEDLLAVTGEINLSDYEKIITAENFVREIQMAVEIEYDKEENQPKKIIGDLMPIILDKLFNLTPQQSPQILQLVLNNLNQKHILFWFNNEEMQTIAENFLWSGEIKNSSSDFLMVVHTNIGGGKTDRVIENKIEHRVEVNEQGEIINTVTLTKKHTGQSGDIFEDQNNVDYLRFYVPPGSQLISAEGFDYIPQQMFKMATDYKKLEKDSYLLEIEQNPVLNEEFNTRITDEFNKTCFGNWLQIKPGEEKSVVIKYKLPFKLVKEEKSFFEKIFGWLLPDNPETLRYNLIVQKQSGLTSTNFTSHFNLPENYQIINGFSDKKESYNSNSFTYTNDLQTDGYYGLEIK